MVRVNQKVVSMGTLYPSSKEIFGGAFKPQKIEQSCYKCKERNCESCSKNHSFYLSWAGRCKRWIAYSWLYGDSDYSDEINTSFLIGKLWHGGLQAIIEERYGDKVKEIEKKKRIKRKGGLIVSAKIDIGLEVGGESLLVELKTIKPTSLVRAPYNSNILQLQGYLYLFKYEYGELVYIPAYRDIESSFNVGNWRFYSFSKSDKGKEVIDDFNQIFKLIKANKLPRREVSSSCQFCNKKDLCFKGDSFEGFRY